METKKERNLKKNGDIVEIMKKAFIKQDWARCHQEDPSGKEKAKGIVQKVIITYKSGNSIVYDLNDDEFKKWRYFIEKEVRFK